MRRPRRRRPVSSGAVAMSLFVVAGAAIAGAAYARSRPPAAYRIGHRHHGRPVHWACGDVRIALVGPADTGELVTYQRAVAAARQASGVRLIDVGLVDAITVGSPPVDGRDTSAGQVQAVVVLDRSPRETIHAAGDAQPFIVRDRIAAVVVRVYHAALPPYGVLLHELGHVVGLGHSSDPAAVMYGGARETVPEEYTAADRRGFAALRAAQACPSPSAL